MFSFHAKKKREKEKEGIYVVAFPYSHTAFSSSAFSRKQEHDTG
jgi:hypothetical protein